MKWKFNIRQEIKVIVALAGVSLLIAFTQRQQEGVAVKDVVIELDNQEENHFLEEGDIMKLVTTNAASLRGASIGRLDLKEIETKLKTDKHILDAELFGDLKGNLVVNVELRRPIARIVQEDAPDAYIAEDGAVMPVSEKFTSRVVLLSGVFVRKLIASENLNNLEEGKQLLEMIGMINDDIFWKAQIAQLDIDAAGKVTIYPLITGQRVEFGKPDNLEVKFRKLMIFYREILPQRGWTKYKRVNLEYEGQVIAE